METRTAATRTLRRWAGAAPSLIDLVLGTAILVTALLTTAGHGTNNGGVYRARDAQALILILVCALPYYVRRRAPLAIFVVTATAAATLMLRGYDAGALPLVLFFGAYTLAAYRPAREVAAGAVFIVLVLIVLFTGHARDFTMGDLVSSTLAFGAAMLAGWTVQSRGQRIDTFDRERAETARRVAADERLRIAQELHDVVAHSLGVIAVQAGVGMHVIDSDPAEAKRSFENISRTSRSSLAEIRRLLAVVRNTDETPSYTPTPGLADVSRLADEVTGAGLRVDVRVCGDVDAVPPGVGLAAYRIVQEALTNALRHASARSAMVRLDGRTGLLLIEVIDDGRGPIGGLVRGHGLIGMGERAAMYGGSVDAGPGATGGFRVAAQLPYVAEPVS